VDHESEHTVEQIACE